MPSNVLLAPTHRGIDFTTPGSDQPIRFSLPEGESLGMRVNQSDHSAPSLAEKPMRRVRTIDWSVLD